MSARITQVVIATRVRQPLWFDYGMYPGIEIRLDDAATKHRVRVQAPTRRITMDDYFLHGAQWTVEEWARMTMCLGRAVPRRAIYHETHLDWAK